MHGFRLGDEIAGRFRLERRLRRGERGDHFLARDRILRETIGLRLESTGSTGCGDVLDALRRQLLIARRITHRGVCRVYDAFLHPSPSGREILVVTTDAQEGPSLGSWLRTHGPPPRLVAFRWAVELAAAFDAAGPGGAEYLSCSPGDVILVPDGGSDSTQAPFGLRPVFAGLRTTGDARCEDAAPQVRDAPFYPGTLVRFAGLVHWLSSGRLPTAGRAARDLHRTTRRVLDRALSRPASFTCASELVRAFRASPPRPGLADRASRPALPMVLAIVVSFLLVSAFAIPEMAREPLARASTAATTELASEQLDEAAEQLRRLDAAAAVGTLRRVGSAGARRAEFHGLLSEAFWILGEEAASRRQAELARTSFGDSDETESLVEEARRHHRRYTWREAARLYDVAWTRGGAGVDVGFALAGVLLRLSELERAALVLDELAARPVSAGDPRLKLARAVLARRTGGAREALPHARGALARAEAAEAPLLVAEAQRVVGETLLRLGELEAARLHLERSAAAFESGGNPSLAGLALYGVAEIRRLAADRGAASAAWSAAARRQEAAGSLRRLAVVWRTAPQYGPDRGPGALAEQLTEMERICDQVWDPPCLALVSHHRSTLAFERGDVEAAGRWMDRSLQLHRTLRLRRGEAANLNNVAHLFLARQEWERAADTFGDALELAVEMDDRHLELLLRYNSAWLEWSRGETDAARRHLEQVLASPPIDPRLVVDSRLLAARLAAAEGRSGEAETEVLRALRIARQKSLLDRETRANQALVELRRSVRDGPSPKGGRTS